MTSRVNKLAMQGGMHTKRRAKSRQDMLKLCSGRSSPSDMSP